MAEIILSLKPDYFKALLTTKKHFEYRSRIPEDETVAYIYLSSPAKMIVGKFDLGKRQSIQGFLDSHSQKHPAYSDLIRHKNEGARYFSAIHSLSLLEAPISLEMAKDLSANFRAPQGYHYLKNYETLQEHLHQAQNQTFAINPMEELDLLGLFTKDIVERYAQEIEAPDYLAPYH